MAAGKSVTLGVYFLYTNIYKKKIYFQLLWYTVCVAICIRRLRITIIWSIIGIRLYF